MKVQFVSKKEKYKKGIVRKNIETLARNISLKIIIIFKYLQVLNAP